MSRSNNRNRRMVPGAIPAIDALKYEIAANLGLDDVLEKKGWKGLSTEDAGNVGGAIQQVINELGQKELIKHYKNNTIAEISHLSPDSRPEHYDLTRTRISEINEDNQGTK